MISISKGPLELFAFRVESKTGFRPVLKELQDQVENEKKENAKNKEGEKDLFNSATFYTFGLVDLLLILEGNLPRQFLPIVEGTRFFQNIRCFRFSDQQPLLEQAKNHPFSVIQCYRLNQKLTAKIGYKSVVEKMMPQMTALQQSYDQHLRFSIYGTLGWAEIMVFVSTDSFAQLLEWLQRSRWLMDDKRKEYFFDSTFSLPMMHIDCNEGIIQPKPGLPKDLVSARICLGCNCKELQELQHSVTVLFDGYDFNSSRLLGKSDLTIGVGSIPLDHLCSCILKIQEMAEAGVTHVETHLQAPTEFRSNPFQ